MIVEIEKGGHESLFLTRIGLRGLGTWFVENAIFILTSPAISLISESIYCIFISYREQRSTASR